MIKQKFNEKWMLYELASLLHYQGPVNLTNKVPRIISKYFQSCYW